MVTSFPLSKPVASAASPPPAGGPANPFLFLLRLFRLFRLGEPAAVVFRHCRVQTLRQNHFHGVTGFAHHLCCRLQFRFLHRPQDRKSTRLNSSHVSISYAVFCLKKKKKTKNKQLDTTNSQINTMNINN